MKKAHALLLAKGYKNVVNTSATKPYDYTCQRNRTSFFVEVKGTQTSGSTVVLTRGGEVLQQCTGRSVLVLVHSVKVTTTKPLRVSGGTVEFKENWSLREQDLKPLQYVWVVK